MPQCVKNQKDALGTLHAFGYLQENRILNPKTRQRGERLLVRGHPVKKKKLRLSFKKMEAILKPQFGGVLKKK